MVTDESGAAKPEFDGLQQLLEGCALPATNAAQMLSEYANTPSAAGSWDAFVAHNWLPVLSLALGSEWRSKYDGEVAAMIALQLSLQPPASSGSPAGSSSKESSSAGASNSSSSGPVPAAAAAAAGTPANGMSSAGAPYARPAPVVQHAAAASASCVAVNSAAPVAAAATRAFTVEAVDVDGKRRRLRRKRAASPDSPYSSPTPPPDEEGTGGSPANGMQQSGQQQTGGPPDTPGGSSTSAEVGDNIPGVVSSSRECGSKPFLVQRVIRQVSKLNINGSAAAEAAAGQEADLGGAPTSSGASHSRSGAVPAAAAVSTDGAGVQQTAGTASRSVRVTDTPGLDSRATGAAQPELQRGLLDSLSLVHDLSQRIVANLQEEVASRGLSLPQQVAAPASGSASLPLSMLLGGSLVDRMDLLGRTALHVAAATGRADIVRQLTAAGTSINKPLPMDYRTLLKQHPDMRLEQLELQQEGEEEEEEEGSDSESPGETCEPESCGEGKPCSACSGGSASSARTAKPVRRQSGRAPPPKRGRYVTAGPPELSAPSLQYCTALHLAALYGHLEVVVELLSYRQCDVNAKNIEGATPLHLAAYAGHEQVVARLCRTPGVQLDAPDLQGRAPLHLAAARGHDAVVVELWAKGALVDPCDLHGWTALHYASRTGHTEVAAKLVIAGASVAACDPHAIAPAHLAAERGFSDIVEKLLLAGYMPDSVAGPLADGTEGGSALHLAASQGCEAAVLALLHAGADPRRLDFSARNSLDLAVLNGHPHLVPALLAAGCWFTNGSDFEECPPQPAAGEPAARQLELLRCLAADPPMKHPAWDNLGDGRGMVAESFRLSFAECAARAGQLEVLQALVARGLDLSGRDGSMVLAAAVHSGAAPLVAWLLEGGRCNVEAALEQEDLLHEAASRGDMQVLQSLLAAAGAACLARTDGRGLGRIPLHSAIIHGQSAAAELLIQAHLPGREQVSTATAAAQAGGQPAAPAFAAPAAPAAPSMASQDTAHAAASGEGSAASISGEGTDVSTPAAFGGGLNVADSRGYTALHWAALKGSTGILRKLLASGAATDLVSGEGQTPLHLAAKAGHVGAAHALLDAGASATAMDAHGCMPLHYCALRGDLALFVLLFSPSAPSLGPSAGAGAALLTAAIRGGSSEMVGIVLMTGAATPQNCREAGQMPVHAAAREGSLDVLQYLYGSGFDMAELDSERKLPLHHAAIGCGQAGLCARRGADHHQVAEVLLASGCRVDAQDSHGCTPLHFAAGAGALGMLCRFIELSPAGTAGTDLADSIGWTPLFWACNNGHAAAAERLLVEGASPWNRDCNQRLPIHFASEAGHVACVRLLVGHMRRTQDPQAPADAPAAARASVFELKDQNGQTPVQLAAEHGHPDCVALLLDGDGTAESKRRSALHLAAQQGRAEIVRQVLASRRLAVNAKDTDGWLPIHYAAAAGHADIVQALLAAGSDAEEPAADGDSPLHKAAIGGHMEVVRLLKPRSQLDQRNSSGSTPLYNAASQGHLVVMRELVEEGAAVDAATTNGCSPLYIAANNGFADAAALLLDLGADPDLETTSGCTPLHAAALNGHTAVVERLVAAGCDVDLQSQNGSSALHNAASGGHTAVVEVLLAAKADCDVQNSNGNTPLHLAAGKGWIEVAERLAVAGADPCIKNSKGWLAIQSASNSGSFEVVLKLAQHGSPWRLKGDSDVVKLLAKKSSYKPSYVEGRLRLAEKERQRRLAKQEAAAAAEGSLGGDSSGGEADLQQAAAAADAIMAKLLEEEEADKERAERQKAKKAARKQKAAAKKQQQAAAEEEERKRQEAQAEEEADPKGSPPGRKAADKAAPGISDPASTLGSCGGSSDSEEAAERAVSAAAEALGAANLDDGEQQAATQTGSGTSSSSPTSSAAVQSQRRQKQQQGSPGSGGGSAKQAAAPTAAKPAAKAAVVAAPAAKVLSAPNSAHPAAASPVRHVLAVGLKSTPPAAGKTGKVGASHPTSPAPRTAPHVVAATRSQAAGPAKLATGASGAPSGQHHLQAKPSAAAPAAQSAAAAAGVGPHAAAVAGQPRPRQLPTAAPALVPGAPPVSRPAPWAGVAAARASAVHQQPQPEKPSPAQPQQERHQLEHQRQGVAPAVQQAPAITRPAHIAGSLPPPPAAQLQRTSDPAVPAPSLGMAPRTTTPWSAPPATLLHHIPLAAPSTAVAALQPAAGSSDGLKSGPVAGASYLLQATMQQQQPFQPQVPAASPLHSALALVKGGSTGAAGAIHTNSRSHTTFPQQPAPTLLPPSTSAALQAQRAQQAQRLQPGAPIAGFVPLFGLNLPALQGLGVDWSVQGTTAASSFSSPARHPVGALADPPAMAPQPPAMAPQPASAVAAPAAVTAAAAGFVGGSFSPSDASSIESSSEADELLNGIHGHISRSLAPGNAGAAAPFSVHASPQAAAPKSTLGAALPPTLAADADGIDDVLRLQPWLNE